MAQLFPNVLRAFGSLFDWIFFSGSGLATALSTVDLAVSGPLIALGTFLSLVLASSCSVAGKFFSLKAAKHDKIQSLAEQTVVEISSLVSRALADSEISDFEFQEINQKFGAFTMQKSKLRSFFHTVDGRRRPSHLT